MKKLPSHYPLLRHGRPAALFLLLSAALPSTAFARKPVAALPAAAPTASFPDPVPPPAPDQKRMLAQDSRLDRVVSVDVISVPLGEVLQQQSLDKSTEKMEDGHRFLLTAAPDCADLKLQVRLNARPLRALMTALAEMLPGTWTRTPHGYQLSMTKQAAGARAEWWRLFLGERDKALALQRQAVLAAMQNKARRRQASDPEPDEPSDHAVEEELANQHDFFHTLPQSLKEQIAANLDDRHFYEVGHLVFSNAGERFGTVGWLSQMSPETQETFKTAMQDNVNRLAQAPPALQGYVRQAQSGLAALNPNRVYFLFMNEGRIVMAMPFNSPPSSSALDLDVPMTVNMLPLLLDQTRLADVVYGGADLPAAAKRAAGVLRNRGDALLPEMKILIYQVYGLGEAAPPEWKQLAAYQRGRVWPNLLPQVGPEDKEGTRVTRTPNPIMISRAAQTDWLGEQGHMEYVSDYYSHGGYQMPPEQRKLPLRRPLATELDEMAAKRDVSWKKDEDGITLIRNNRWYRDDDLEVPEPLLRRWFAHVVRDRRRQETAQASIPAVPQSPEEQGAAVKQIWDWAAEVYNTLSPWQIYNGLALFQPEEKDLAPQNDATAAKLFEGAKHHIPQTGEVASPNYDAFAYLTRMPPFSMTVNELNAYLHTTHLYSTLDDTGRAALLAGRLPASTLSPAQLAEATSLLPMLPQALQSFPADSVLLSLPSAGEDTYRILFGAPLPTDGLKVVMPQSDPPAPPGP